MATQPRVSHIISDELLAHFCLVFRHFAQNILAHCRPFSLVFPSRSFFSSFLLYHFSTVMRFSVSGSRLMFPNFHVRAPPAKFLHPSLVFYKDSFSPISSIFLIFLFLHHRFTLSVAREAGGNSKMYRNQSVTPPKASTTFSRYKSSHPPSLEGGGYTKRRRKESSI